MIKSTFGISKAPFVNDNLSLLPQQQTIIDLIKVHAQHGGFCVVIGNPGVGKSVLREHIEALANERDVTVAACSQTMHSYWNILKQLAESLKINVPQKELEKQLIQTAYSHVRERKTLYTLIDEAHLLDMTVLRKLRLLFDRFPKNHNLVLFGQRDLFYYLSMNINQDIKSRITYSQTIYGLCDDDMQHYIQQELDKVKLGANTFDEAALELIIRSVQGNLRLCRNLCYASLVDACRDGKRMVNTNHVNAILIQPHWRSHEELIKQQVA